MRQEVNFLEREIKGKLELKKKNLKLSKLNERYRVKRRKLKTVIEELKQRMLVKSAKIRRYQQKIENLDNVEFFILKYVKFNGDGVRPSNVLNDKRSKRFWVNICSIGKGPT